MTLPNLTERQIAAMSPRARTQYLAARKHQELWGHLPLAHQQLLVGMESLSEDAVENHARERKTDPVHFAATRAYFRWPIGMEMSLKEYDAAVELVLRQSHGF